MEYKILQACENGNLEEVKLLIEGNPNLINTTDKDRYTPLHRACYSNNVEVVKYLIQKGANIGAKTEMQWEPLHSCCQWNHKECAAILIQNGANVNAKSEGSMFLLFRILKPRGRDLFEVKIIFIVYMYRNVIKIVTLDHPLTRK